MHCCGGISFLNPKVMFPFKVSGTEEVLLGFFSPCLFPTRGFHNFIGKQKAQNNGNCWSIPDSDAKPDE